MIKSYFKDFKTGKETVIYYTEEEVIEIKVKEEELALEQSLIPTKEQINDAEFELKLLEKLTAWGVII